MKDVIIVLSHHIESDGNISEEYKKRLDKGIELYLVREARKIIICGNEGTEAISKYLSARAIRQRK